MRHKLKVLADIFISRNFLMFTLLGSLNTFNAALFSSLSSKILQDNVAAVVGYICALTISYFLNCWLTFKKKPSVPRYFKFLASYIPTFILYFLVTFITINALDLPQFWATVLAAMTGGPLTFVIIKLYAFGKPKNDE